jgi:drug/metabolite transporter (DMT)-like permease
VSTARPTLGAARWLALAAAAATGVQVGASMVATRVVVDQVGPASLALMRYAIAVCCLLPPALVLGRGARFARGDVLPIAALGIGQFGLLIALLNVGLRSVPSGRAALIFATFPLLTLIFAAALGRERLTPSKLLGVALTIVGVAAAMADRLSLAEETARPWLGELAILGSAALGAACSVLYRPYLVRYPTLRVSAFAMLAAIVFLTLPAAGEGFFAAPPHFAPAGWLAVFFIGTASGAGYFAWLWALGHAPPSEVTVFLGLSPLTAALLGALVLGEPLAGGALVGVVLVIAGLWLAVGPGSTWADAHSADAGSR